jgi:hypothetical protein
MKLEDIVLNEGEMICDKCEGTGKESNTSASTLYSRFCKKCLGSGKVDWVDNAMGGKKPTVGEFIFIGSRDMMSSTLTVASGKDMKIGELTLDDYIRDVMAKRMAEEIDKILLEQLVNPNSKFEHIFKMMKENK